MDAATIYRLSGRMFGRGGYAHVHQAWHREKKHEVALKRALPGAEPHERIRREIHAQKRLAHPNIMPIQDHDPGYSWYTMPVARGTLESLREELDEEALISILLNLADALEVAHSQQLLHRDISPNNILALAENAESRERWVLADWGMVRQPQHGTLPQLTRTGHRMGTPGFDAPELDIDPRTATPAVDVYSLGRVAAWFVTRRKPSTGRLLLPDGAALHWRPFVLGCTQENVEKRVKSIAGLRELLLRAMRERDEPAASRARRLVDDLLRGVADNLDPLASLAEIYQDDADLFIDHLARVPTHRMRVWSASYPDRAAVLGSAMADHLVESDWGDRDRQYADTPLSFIHALLRGLLDVGQIGPAQDLATSFFYADAHWQNPGQLIRTRDWLNSLSGPAAGAMTRAIALCKDPEGVATYYGEDGWRPASPALQTVIPLT